MSAERLAELQQLLTDWRGANISLHKEVQELRVQLVEANARADRDMHERASFATALDHERKRVLELQRQIAAEGQRADDAEAKFHQTHIRIQSDIEKRSASLLVAIGGVIVDAGNVPVPDADSGLPDAVRVILSQRDAAICVLRKIRGWDLGASDREAMMKMCREIIDTALSAPAQPAICGCYEPNSAGGRFCINCKLPLAPPAPPEICPECGAVKARRNSVLECMNCTAATKEHCPRRLIGEAQPPHMPCDTGDFSRDATARPATPNAVVVAPSAPTDFLAGARAARAKLEATGVRLGSPLLDELQDAPTECTCGMDDVMHMRDCPGHLFAVAERAAMERVIEAARSLLVDADAVRSKGGMLSYSTVTVTPLRRLFDAVAALGAICAKSGKVAP